MQATVVKMGASLGLKVPNAVIKNLDLKVGTKIEMNFIQDRTLVICKKSKIRNGWNTAFAQYAIENEDKLMLPDFLDLETDAFL